MSIGKKLNIVLFILIAIIAVSTIISSISYNTIQSRTDEAMDVRMEQVRMIDDIRFNLAMQGLYARALVTDPKEENVTNLTNYADKLDANIEHLKQSADTKDTEALLNDCLLYTSPSPRDRG